MLIDKIFQDFKINCDAKIYDFGCNDGYMLKRLSKLGFKNLYFFDKEICYMKALNSIAMYELPEEETKYDVIIMAKVLCMMNSQERKDTVSMLRNKLNAGGILIIEEYNTLRATTSGVEKSMLTKIFGVNRLISPKMFDIFYPAKPLFDNIYASYFYRLRNKIYRNTDVGVIIGRF